jgi:hypothetical protein
MKSFGTVFSLVVVGILAASASSCGVTNADDPAELGMAESALSTTVLTPFQGECTTTKSLDRVTLSPGNDVIRGACSLTCKKSAFRMGIWNVAVVKPDGSSPSADNLGSGPTRAAQVDVPYVPGSYSVSCTTLWQEKSGSTSFFGSGGTFIGGPF